MLTAVSLLHKRLMQNVIPVQCTAENTHNCTMLRDLSLEVCQQDHIGFTGMSFNYFTGLM
jgi:hypothetical protein